MLFKNHNDNQDTDISTVSIVADVPAYDVPKILGYTKQMSKVGGVKIRELSIISAYDVANKVSDSDEDYDDEESIEDIAKRLSEGLGSFGEEIEINEEIKNLPKEPYDNVTDISVDAIQRDISSLLKSLQTRVRPASNSNKEEKELYIAKGESSPNTAKEMPIKKYIAQAVLPESKLKLLGRGKMALKVVGDTLDVNTYTVDNIYLVDKKGILKYNKLYKSSGKSSADRFIVRKYSNIRNVATNGLK